jgi:hypothetical protein
VRAAEEVRLVLAGVPAARRAVAVRETAHREVEAPVLAAHARERQHEVCLVDSQVGLEAPIARIGDVVRRDLDRGLRAIVAVVEVELTPRRDELFV